MTQQRRDQLAANLAAVHRRIAGAALPGATPTLVVVTKFFPASDADLLAELGVRHIGENKDQEASAKVAELTHRDLLTVHFIGRLQSNKAHSVARYADVVQSVDRPKLIGALSRGAVERGRDLEVLIQVSLDGDTSRGGALPQDVARLGDLVAEAPGLALRGVMAIAPLEAEPEPAFALLRTVSDRVSADHPQAWWISAGMSGDLEAALAQGATHLRVGTAILGSRESHG